MTRQEQISRLESSLKKLHRQFNDEALSVFPDPKKLDAIHQSREIVKRKLDFATKSSCDDCSKFDRFTGINDY
jgi:hypothetical protein